jgi:hypothetical protein
VDIGHVWVFAFSREREREIFIWSIESSVSAPLGVFPFPTSDEG